jgi:hypothetical protein
VNPFHQEISAAVRLPKSVCGTQQAVFPLTRHKQNTRCAVRMMLRSQRHATSSGDWLVGLGLNRPIGRESVLKIAKASGEQ